MIIEKPQPMQIGDKYYFTLSSYDPVTVDVVVPMTTDADVDYALATLVGRDGGSADGLTDEWVAEHYDGVGSVEEFRQGLRAQLSQMNASYAEDSKQAKCVAELAKRLVQAVPDTLVDGYREILREQFAQDIAERGMSEADFLSGIGSSPAMVDELFRSQAQEMAEQFAALDAFVDERKLTVADEEIAGLLALPQDSAEQMVQEARDRGQLEQVRRSALRNKAADVVCAECSCNYHHETAEEAQKRAEEYEQLARMQQMQEELAAKKSEVDALENEARTIADMAGDAAGDPDGPDDDSHAGFHLV